MTDLDDSLRLLREQCREYARDLRRYALETDRAPDRFTDHLDSPGLLAVQELQKVLPSQLAAAVAAVELAAGDAGVLMACPGAALAAVLTRVLGDEEQNDRVQRAMAGGRAWAYLAVTEPDGGSSPTRLGTELRPDNAGGHLLHGVKRYIGNGARASIGVVLARTGPGPLALRAVLVDRNTPGVRARALDTIGLRGAGISELSFDAVPVRAADLLGRHLSAPRRGIWGVRQAFNTVRVQVAAMAVGTALAVQDYVLTANRHWLAAPLAELAAARDEIEAARLLTYRAARAVDIDRADAFHPAMAKLVAVDLVKRVCDRLPSLLGRGALLEHPLLEKWWRDASAFEFMEGTSHIQSLQVAQGQLRREAIHD